MDFVKKHTAKIVISVGAAAFLFGGYYLLKDSIKEQPIVNNQSINSTNTSTIFVKDPYYNDMISKMKEKISKEPGTNGLSKESIMGINIIIIQMFTDDYLKLMKEGRVNRRKNLDNMSLFITEFLDNTQKSEILIENVTREVLKDLDLTISEFETSCEKIMMVDQQFAMQNMQMFEAVKMRQPSTRETPLTKDDIVAMIRFQVEKYREIDIDQPNLNPQHKLMIKQTYISDLSSVKFGFEEEDIGKNPAVMGHPDIMTASREMQMVLFEEQRKLGGMVN